MEIGRINFGSTQDWADNIFNNINSNMASEYVIEFAQNEGNKKIRVENMVLLSPQFDITKPFMFRISENKEMGKEATGFSNNMTDLIDSVVKKKGKK